MEKIVQRQLMLSALKYLSTSGHTDLLDKYSGVLDKYSGAKHEDNLSMPTAGSLWMDTWSLKLFVVHFFSGKGAL